MLPMIGKNGLVQKVKYLLRKARMPRFLHYFGPKTYELWNHVFALFIKESCRLSYRRTTQFCRSLGFLVATKSTLQRYAAKLKLPFWQHILSLTVGKINAFASIDGTGLERTSPSWHYIKRIDGKMPRTGYKLSMFSTTKHKIISLRLRAKPAHDIKDVMYLLGRAKQCPPTLLMDKGYDAEWLHEACQQKGIRSIIPPRKNTKRGKNRKKLARKFPQKKYNKRSNIESTFHALKTKFGSSVSSKHIETARTQIHIRAILHNITLKTLQVLGHSRGFG